MVGIASDAIPIKFFIFFLRAKRGELGQFQVFFWGVAQSLGQNDGLRSREREGGGEEVNWWWMASRSLGWDGPSGAGGQGAGGDSRIQRRRRSTSAGMARAAANRTRARTRQRRGIKYMA